MAAIAGLGVVLALVAAACTGRIGGDGDAPADGAGLGPADPDPASRRPRAARRLSAPQLQAAIVAATGFDYLGRARVVDPASPQGSEVVDDAKLLEVYGESLGNPDYNYTTQHDLSPSVTFSKLTGDAVRYSCGRAADAEVLQADAPGRPAHLLIEAGPDDRWPEGGPAVRANIVVLALRWWGHEQSLDAPDTDALVDVFRIAQGAAADASGAGGGSASADPEHVQVAAAWRAVCIAMLQDPRFLTY